MSKGKMEFMQVAAVGVGIVVAIMGLVVLGLWSLANGWTREGVNWWAVAATMAIVPVFLFGFYLGKVEARGLLSGFDKSLDRMAKVIGDVATMRESVRVTARTAPRSPAGQYVVVPQLPMITHRTIESDEVIDV